MNDMEFTKDAIKRIVASVIERREKLGESAGGSGHFGYTSYNITRISAPVEVQEKGKTLFKVTCTYELVVETEFTYYPDNPPHRFPKEIELLLDREGNVVP